MRSIQGTRLSAILFGGVGGERIAALAGGDVLYGDGAISGGAGSASLTGGADLLRGGDCDDTLYGDGTVDADLGAELIGGDDRLVGGDGNDVLWGDGTAFVPEADTGTATLIGGNDSLDGGEGDDVLYGDGTRRGCSSPAPR